MLDTSNMHEETQSVIAAHAIAKDYGVLGEED
jgi:hypothetical protein